MMKTDDHPQHLVVAVRAGIVSNYSCKMIFFNVIHQIQINKDHADPPKKSGVLVVSQDAPVEGLQDYIWRRLLYGPSLVSP